MKQIKTFLLCMSLLVAVSACEPKDKYISFTGYAQGGVYKVTLNTRGVDVRATEIKARVDSILCDIDNSLSGYNKNSLLSRFNAGETVEADSLFVDMYSYAHQVFAQTGGIVDAASAPLFDMWGFGFKSGDMPSDEDVRRVLAECGMERLTPDMSCGLVAPANLLLVQDGALPQLNYNAIAQGYSCDVVARYLYSIGVKDMMVDIGEIFCDGKNPSGKQWTIGVDRPVDGNNELGADMQGKFAVPSGAHGVVTSGNYRKFYIKDGKKYAHSIDPRTGYPVTRNLLSATIVACDGLWADAYATYCMVIGLEESIKFLSSRPDLEGCLIYDEDGEFKTWCSEGFILEEI